VRRTLQAFERFAKPQTGPTERRIVGRVDRLDDAAQFVEISLDRRTAGERQLAGDEIDRLNAVGSLVDRGDTRIAIKLPWTCTPSEVTSMPMSLEKALAKGVSNEARACPASRAALSGPRSARSSASAVA
jgi:hypothetical protein